MSGALMASAFVVFVGLIGVVTLNTWPQARDLLGGGDRGVVLNSRVTASPPPARHSGTLNLVKLLGGGPGPATQHQGGGARSPIPPVGVPGSNVAPGGSGGGRTPIEPPEQPSPPTGPPTQSPTVVGQVVSGAGNAVQSTTDSLGNALGGSDSPGLGGVVGGVGRTLNSDVQSLAGNL